MGYRSAIIAAQVSTSRQGTRRTARDRSSARPQPFQQYSSARHSDTSHTANFRSARRQRLASRLIPLSRFTLSNELVSYGPRTGPASPRRQQRLNLNQPQAASRRVTARHTLARSASKDLAMPTTANSLAKRTTTTRAQRSPTRESQIAFISALATDRWCADAGSAVNTT